MIQTIQFYRYGLNDRTPDFLFYSAAWAKFRQFSINYNIPRSVFGNAPIRGANVAFIARILFDIYNKLPGADPSISGGQGISGARLPNQQTFTVNINVNF